MNDYVKVSAKLVARSRDAFMIEHDGVKHWIPFSLIHAADEKILLSSALGQVVPFRVREWKARAIGL